MTLTLENVGDNDLTTLDVRLNSLDEYSISVPEPSTYIVSLLPGEEKTRAFQVSADLTGRLYISIDGWQNGEEFHWETPGIPITVGHEVAELVNLFALTEPYPPPGEKIRCETTVRGLDDSEEDLSLEFWAQKPTGEFEELASMDIKVVDGEETTYSVDIEPEEEGSYTIHAYLYDGVRRIGHEVDYVYVAES
jgi:hypothetical protein